MIPSLQAESWVEDAARNVSELKTEMAVMTAHLKTLGAVSESLTISGGTVTPSGGRVLLSGEGAADDDLTSITTTYQGQNNELVLMGSWSEVITIKHGTGTDQIAAPNGNDFVLLGAVWGVRLRYDIASSHYRVMEYIIPMTPIGNQKFREMRGLAVTDNNAFILWMQSGGIAGFFDYTNGPTEDTWETHRDAGLVIEIEDGAYYDGAGRAYRHIGVTSITVPAPTTNPRKDIIIFTPSTEIVSRLGGTEAGSPTAPTISGEQVLLSELYLEPGETVMGNDSGEGYTNYITDKRDGQWINV